MDTKMVLVTMEDVVAAVLHQGSATGRTIEPYYRQKALVGAVFGALRAVAHGFQQLLARLGWRHVAL